MSESPKATFELISENDRVRVTRWTFLENQSTAMHIHEWDYIAIPITGGQFHVTMADGSELEMTQFAGEPYSRNAGVHHDVRFVGEGTAQFVEVEFLH